MTCSSSPAMRCLCRRSTSEEPRHGRGAPAVLPSASGAVDHRDGVCTRHCISCRTNRMRQRTASGLMVVGLSRQRTTGSATISIAYPGAEFASKVLKALMGKKCLVSPSYVHLDMGAQGGSRPRPGVVRPSPLHTRTRRHRTLSRAAHTNFLRQQLRPASSVSAFALTHVTPHPVE
ncbi:hypothetical protein BC834DRAFT_436601 [Gloeopeniophorella convolvens]|nr:hypothetical protein BC834DRAFT_436601 [Gloeopeniophorella convolvens]